MRLGLIPIGLCLFGADLVAQIEPPIVVKDITVIADVGPAVGSAPATKSASIKAPFSSFPENLSPAVQFCYFAAETPTEGREICRFPDANMSAGYVKADLFDLGVTANASSCSPDLLTIVGATHLFFRARAIPELPLYHHLDAEDDPLTGKPKVDVVVIDASVTYRTQAIAAVGAKLAVFAFAGTDAAPTARFGVVDPTADPLALAAYEDCAPGPQTPTDLVDCGLADALLAGDTTGFAAYRDTGSTTSTAWYLTRATGKLTASLIPAPSGTFAKAIERLAVVGTSLFLFENNDAGGYRLYRFDGTTTTAVTDAGAPIQDALLSVSSVSTLWFSRGATVGPQTMWRCAAGGSTANGVPPLSPLIVPRIITSLCTHEEEPVSGSGAGETHVYVLGTRTGGLNPTTLWRVADAVPDGDAAVIPHLCGVASPSSLFVSAHNLVSLVVRGTGHHLAFLTADVQGGVLRWSVVVATEGTNDGVATTDHEFLYSQQVITPLAAGAGPSLLTACPLDPTGTGSVTRFFLFRAQHATDGMHLWHVMLL